MRENLDRFEGITTRLGRLAVAACVCVWLGAAAANAQVTNEVVEVEVGLDAQALRDEVRDRPVDRDIINTALVFTNATKWPGEARCVAYDGDGRPIGRTRTKIPPNGLRWLRASTLVNGTDFIGSVRCRTMGEIDGSAVLIGADVTDLRVVETHHGGAFRIRFPLVVSY